MFEIIRNFAANACAQGPGGISFLPTWYKYLPRDTSTTAAGQCSVKFSGQNGTITSTDISAILLAVVEILLRLGAIVAVGYVIWGGIQYILSQGTPDKTKDAKDTIVNALIGLVLTIMATGIVNFIGGRLL